MYDVSEFQVGAIGAAETARADATRSYFAKLASEEAARNARPFRFEDLEGKPEPEKWGPCYPKTASAAVEKWRRLARVRELNDDEKRAHGQAVGDWIRGLNNLAAKRWRVPDSDLHYPKYFTCEALRGKIRAAFAAQAGADRRDWAAGQAKSKSVGDSGLTIQQVYARAMAEKSGAAPIGPRAYARLSALGAA